MCLDKPLKFETSETVFKIFDYIKGKLYFPWSGTEKVVPLQKWLNEKEFRCNKLCETLPFLDKKPNRYPTGFHSYRSKKRAQDRRDIGFSENRVVAKCKIRKILQTGIQDNRQVIVSEELYVEEILK